MRELKPHTSKPEVQKTNFQYSPKCLQENKSQIKSESSTKRRELKSERYLMNQKEDDPWKQRAQMTQVVSAHGSGSC